VVALGSGVTRFREGDRITPTFFRNWIDGPPAPGRFALGAPPADGVLAEFVAVHENDAAAVPKHLSFEEGSTLPCAGVTAWHALSIHCRVKPGDSVLLLGTGGVSMFGLQLSRAAGARVLMTSSSDEKLERARKMGASGLINYKRTPEWEKEVLKLTDNLGVDHVIEVGGVGTLARSMQAVGYAGHIALIGVLAGFVGDTNPHPIMRKGAHLHGIFVGNRAMLESLGRALEASDIHPVIDRVFPMEQTKEALQHMQRGAHFGKVVIKI
jgi:NADPH:quinone reductase-like Zn-dependent oxidoreductase